MFSKILIAHPGEVAVRVARTCRHLGVEAVAIRQPGNPPPFYVDACDEAIELPTDATGTPTTADFIDAAVKAKVDAVHAGYAPGLLAPELSEGLRGAGIAVVGVDPAQAQPLVASEALRQTATEVGVRMVNEECDTSRAQHIAVFVAAYGKREAIPICAWEQSIRHAGVSFAECPAPPLFMRTDGEALRMALFDAAARLFAGLEYRGLCTMEFLLDRNRRFWLTGAKPGLPHEHALCEMVTGLDPVALQLGIAAGQEVDPKLEEIQPNGHSATIEVRVEPAEDVIEEIHFPPAPQRTVRIEPMVTPGGTIDVWDQPVAARLTTFAPIRHRAILLLDRMLAEAHVSPASTNIATLRSLFVHHAFRAGQYDDTFVERHLSA